MSGATYRIEASHEPSSRDDTLPWIARIIRLSDEAAVGSAWGLTAIIAIGRARELVAMRDEALPEQTTYVDEHGNITGPPAPHSVKV